MVDDSENFPRHAGASDSGREAGHGPSDAHPRYFGALSIQENIVSKAQVDEVLSLQRRYALKGETAPRIGYLLAAKGYMTIEQVHSVLRMQTCASRSLFGQLALHYKFCGNKDLASALERQMSERAAGKPQTPLGDLLVASRAIRPHQIRAILQLQGKEIVPCPFCGTSYNARVLNMDARHMCPKCKRVFVPSPSWQGRKWPEEGARKDVGVPHAKPPLAVPSTQLSPPQMKIGPYHFLQRLGVDDSGALYKAINPLTKNTVTIRILSAEIHKDVEEFDLWISCIQKATKLHHPNLQQIQSMNAEHGRMYLVMEYVNGKSLRHLLDEHKRLVPLRVLEILIQVCDALAYGHSRGLVHGDLRPSKILIGIDGCARLSGLGTPKHVIQEMRRIARLGGSLPLYFAPEVLVDESKTNELSDIYGLAAIGYHAITGHAPHEGEGQLNAASGKTEQPIVDPGSLDLAISRNLNRLLMKGLAADPVDRYPSASAFFADLRSCRNEMLAPAPACPDIAPTEPSGAPKAPMLIRSALASRNLPRRSTTKGLSSSDFHAQPQVVARATAAPQESLPRPARTAIASPVGTGVHSRHPSKEGILSHKKGPPVLSKAGVVGLLVLAVFFILSVAYTFIFWGIPAQESKVVRPKLDKSAQQLPVANPAAAEYVILVDAYQKSDKENPQEVLRAIDRYLFKFGAQVPEPEQIKKARILRENILTHGMAASRARLQQELRTFLAQNGYPRALERVKQWESEWGRAAHAAASEESAGIRAAEIRAAESEFAKANEAGKAGNWSAAYALYDSIAKRFNPQLAARAQAEKARIEKNVADAMASAKLAKSNADREQEKSVHEKREEAHYAELRGSLLIALAQMDVASANALLEANAIPGGDIPDESKIQALKTSVSRIASLRDRMTAEAKQGRLRDFLVHHMGGSYGIADATSEGPILDVGGGLLYVRWVEVPRKDLQAIAKRTSDPANGKHLYQLGEYFRAIGQASLAEQSLLAAQDLGEPVGPLLADVRNLTRQIPAKYTELVTPVAKTEAWEEGQDLPKKQNAVMGQSLNALGWKISKGVWAISPHRTLYAVCQDPQAPMLTIRRELKHFASLSVETRAVGAAVGFSFGSRQRFMANPNGKWQKLELTISEGDQLRFQVDGQIVQSLNDTGRAISSEQLPDWVYVRCEGCRCEVRNFLVDGIDIDIAELPWAFVKSTHNLTVQTAQDGERLKHQGWVIANGVWAITPNDCYMGASRQGAASLQRSITAPFQRLTVELRGDGEEAGFSFGKGMRYLLKSTDRWQKLSLEVVMDDRLRMTVDGEARASLEAVKEFKGGNLLKVFYLHVQGGASEFRNLSIDGISIVKPPTEEPQAVQVVEEALVSRQDPVEEAKIKARGWEILGGVWRLEGDGALSGAREPGSNLMSLKRKLPTFTELTVEMRGEGDLAGFSFGQGKRWMTRPTEQWQTLQIKVLGNNRLQFLINHEARSSLDDTSEGTNGQLGELLNLRADGVNIEFRNFSLVSDSGDSGTPRLK